MSYDLAVWEGDRPANDGAAAAEFRRLCDRYLGSVTPVEPTARICAYLAALLDRFPDIDTEAGEDSPWSTGPLLGEARGPLLYVPMVLGWADEVSAWAAQLAGLHGLNCYDPQINRLRLPVGSPEPVPDRRAVRDAAVRRLTSSMLSRGWKTTRPSRTDPAFAQPQPGGLVFSVSLNPSIGSRGTTFNPVVGAGHLELGRLFEGFLGLRPRDGLAAAVGTAAGLQDLLYADGISLASLTRCVIHSEDEVDAGSDLLLQDLDSYGMPFLEQFTGLGDVITWTYANRGYQARDGVLAVACALDGREAEAVAVIEDYAAYGADQVGGMLEQTTRFVRRFVDHFTIGADARRRLPGA
ncbi:hypothetical protein [Asanoa siamensis]|uniref:Uncharacterized protein n=1 Tax=Asanoa siamensis TaxID=926357 RepID=A0ABQ4CMK5_9ACTN|nr:hypothetical protein [Asanoa siamensis]GIF72527.1 hypothetical protein Asi02nite_20450 [Asanoa siamensis]